jgi:hypothetical protein
MEDVLRRGSFPGAQTTGSTGTEPEVSIGVIVPTGHGDFEVLAIPAVSVTGGFEAFGNLVSAFSSPENFALATGEAPLTGPYVEPIETIQPNRTIENND